MRLGWALCEAECMKVSVRDGAGIKYELMDVMVFF
jgi:hypothetical protein